MTEDRKIIPGKIHVISIKTTQGNIENGNQENTVKVTSHRFQHSLSMGTLVEDKIVAMELKVVIDGLDKNGNVTGAKGSYTHSINFKVDNLDEFIDVDENTKEVNKMDRFMGGTLAGIAYSTVRGIIYGRTQGTALNAVILPVLDPKELLEKDDEPIETADT